MDEPPSHTLESIDTILRHADADLALALRLAGQTEGRLTGKRFARCDRVQGFTQEARTWLRDALANLARLQTAQAAMEDADAG